MFDRTLSNWLKVNLQKIMKAAANCLGNSPMLPNNSIKNLELDYLNIRME